MFLAQANIAYFRWPLDDPRMAGFVDQIQPVNELAEQAEGFIWRLTEPYKPRDVGPPWNDPLLFFNMSVWRDAASLKNFVHLPQHVAVMRNRDEWLLPAPAPAQAVWQVDELIRPTIDDAIEVFDLLANSGDQSFP